MHLPKRWILTVAALSTIPAICGPVTISASGTWGALSGSDAYFVSGQPWTLSFQVANPPPVGSSDPTFFGTSYSNALYTLNGSPVAVTGLQVNFYTFQSFSLCLDNGCVFALSTFNGSPPLFSGPTSNPTMVPGTYLTDSNGFAANDNSVTLGKAAGIQNIFVTQQALPDDAVPEPATWMLTGIGALLFLLPRKALRSAKTLSIAALLTIPVLAGPVTISASGTWGALSGSDAYFVSGQPWTLSFQVGNPPLVADSDATSFETAFSSATYSLNGSPVALTGSRVFFRTNQSIDICLDTGCVFQLTTFGLSPQLFSGATSNPTMVPGIYLTDSQGFGAVDNNLYIGSAGGVQNIFVTSQDALPDDPIVPEPATWALVGIGGLLVAFYRNRSAVPRVR